MAPDSDLPPVIVIFPQKTDRSQLQIMKTTTQLNPVPCEEERDQEDKYSSEI